MAAKKQMKAAKPVKNVNSLRLAANHNEVMLRG
jgi:hypothetical protein